MIASSFHLVRGLALALSLALAGGAGMAAKPDWAGQGKGKHKEEAHTEQGANTATVEIKIGGYFEDRQRVEAQAHYETRRASGHCPPGLAKKNNGCLPPGQAKKWTLGQALPKDVVFYPVPNSVTVKIGLPPAGYRYVRVANDILLVAVGTMIVIDAIEDLLKI